MKIKSKTLSVWLVSAILFLTASSCAPTKESPSTFLPLLLPSDGLSSQTNGSFSQTRALAVSGSLHNLDYSNSSGDREIFISEKTNNQFTDQIFVDGLGREVSFRGFNISGNMKLAQHGFKPFANASDAEIAFGRLGKTTGSNIIRYTIAWEGVHPAVDTIDYNYLDAIISQMKKATAKRMYILLDYHEDLFSRHLFNKNSWHTGNGAPAWITKGGSYPTEYCGIICASWSQNNLTNEAVRRAFRNFWNNAPLSTSLGSRNMQTEFLWQIGKTSAYLKEKLTAEEFSYVLGLDPFNEPVDGGMEGLTPAQWDNQKLWPMYKKVRTILNQNGWENKWVFAEPLVFWNTNIGSAIAPATGGGHLLSPPGPGFVFNSHFYDAGRMGTDLTGIDNATYFKYLDEIRKESRYLKIPVFLSEFGMWLKGTGAKDTPRMINAVYQAMEVSDGNQTSKSRFADFYNPIVSGTQWHWDYYYNNHAEYMNGNPSKLITTKDAWNEEDFSVVGNYGTSFNLNNHVIERGYLRKSQGRLMSSHYNAVGSDTWNKVFSWAAIKPGNTESKYFADKRFQLVIWKGRFSDAPTEVYLPSHFDLTKAIVISEKRIYNQSIPTTPSQETNEAIVIPDRNRETGSGNILHIWDDLDVEENPNSSYHYVLVVDGAGASYSAQTLQEIQSKLNTRILLEQKSPIYLTGKMTYSGYPTEQ
ncbi:glycosyl hydrolase family 5 [Leptospira congkakensis]|uniref:Glycosyl hydrolase family 5 n=1 Tax=Leptospira congkakensis TaxID=2484932 RepID=A0A4Z1A5B7_9LEPT|nr:cellulase family glycosylhydrolase [Leptospira congkakensis]TGL87173.1 glycosyl hydrolase family 5 [Leptospira congkakensis]TGL96741.1 glycosyl hydrolase family 5 [Leptospira congkakensis]TGL97590.1 glycosyl hydrolase family 5 [Leptospira congkakensis]